MSFKEFSSQLNERFIQSCKKNDSEDVNFCLQQGADVNINCKDEDGTTFTGLSIAASRNYPELMDLLLARGADVNKTTLYKYYQDDEDIEEVTPLMIASKQGHHQIVKRLLQVHNIDILFEDSLGWTALHLCAGSKECLEEFAKIPLVDLDWNCVNGVGETPLFSAANLNSDCVKFILSQPSVNPNIQDEDSDTPILLCLKEMDRDMMEEFESHLDNLEFPMPMVGDFDFKEMEDLMKIFKILLDCPRIELEGSLAWAREQAAEPESSSWARRWRTEIVEQLSRAMESRAVDVKKRKHDVSDNTPIEKKRRTDFSQ